MMNREKKIRVPAAAALLCLCLLSACAEKGPGPEELRAEAIEYFQNGDYQSAVDLLNKALDASEGQVSALQFDILKYRAESELRLGDLGAAEKSYGILEQIISDEHEKEELKVITDEMARLRAVREGAELLESGKYREAYAVFNSYAALDGSAAGRAAWFNKAVCEEYLGDYQAAYALFTEYLRAFPNDAEAAKEAEFLKSR